MPPDSDLRESIIIPMMWGDIFGVKLSVVKALINGLYCGYH